MPIPVVEEVVIVIVLFRVQIGSEIYMVTMDELLHLHYIHEKALLLLDSSPLD